MCDSLDDESEDVFVIFHRISITKINMITLSENSFDPFKKAC